MTVGEYSEGVVGSCGWRSCPLLREGVVRHFHLGWRCRLLKGGEPVQMVEIFPSNFEMLFIVVCFFSSTYYIASVLLHMRFLWKIVDFYGVKGEFLRLYRVLNK